MLKKQNCESCKSHLNYSIGALSSSSEDFKTVIRQVCREQLSLKSEIDSKIEAICREEVKKYQTNIISSGCKVELDKDRDRESSR